MKKARYDGGSGTGVDVVVVLADGQTRMVHVDPGHQFPTDIDGVKVPAAFRDGLLEQADWSEVMVNTDAPSTAAAEKE